MKDIVQLLAQYNSQTNTKLYDLLSQQDAIIVEQDAQSYFGSILGILNHIAFSDTLWLRGFRDGSRDFPSLTHADILNIKLPGWKENLCDNLGDLRKIREALDAVFISFTGETSNENLLAPMALKAPTGQMHEYAPGKILMHVFNHQTHHRGAISQILDANGLENDYSNLRHLLG